MQQALEDLQMRLDTPEGNLNPSRRAMAGSLFISGYAAAALSACATPVSTSGDNLVTEDVHFTGAGGYPLPGYLARPEASGRKGTIIVVNEIFGVHDYIKDVCRRLAREGYAALAPDYFDRAGDPAQLTDMGAIREIVGAATNEQVMGDTQGALDWLKERRFVNDRAFGVTGFCWGGSVVWMACARFAEMKAGVAWYGRLVAPQAGGFGAGEARQWPVDVASQLRAPVLGLYAENDRGIPVASVEQMRGALAANGNPTGSEIIVYPGVGHGFHADYRESYDAAVAAQGWSRLLHWFRTHGVA
ncbi:MAG: dienelactone hydrolase family protein [Terricaulis sp.]